MSNKEINLAINKFRGVKNFTGSYDTLSSLADYFLLDASYDIFCKRIRTLPLKGHEQKLVKTINEKYNHFFKKTNAAFNPDELDYLLSKADEMQSYIAPHVEIARIALMECVNDEPLEMQGKMADLWQCIMLAKEASEYHIRTWKTRGFKQNFKAGNRIVRGVVHTMGEIDKDIDGVLKWCYDLAVRIFPEGEVTQKHLERLHLSESVLSKKIYQWLENDLIKENDKRETA